MANSLVSPKFSLTKALPPLNTILTFIVLVFLTWAFFSKETMRFYASFLFLFYSLTKSMWLSVILLGVFQTFLMMPFRIINLIKSANIKEFEAKITQKQSTYEKSFLIKKSAKKGQRIFLYYLIDFFVKLTSYFSMGRLFLTDFYTKPLDPTIIYDFVPYPNYPILDTFFKIPYPQILSTTNLGMGAVFIGWAFLLALAFIIILIKRTYINKKTGSKQLFLPNQVKSFISWLASSILLFGLIMLILFQNFPTQLEIAIFSGDVSIPNRTLNAITALGAFLTLMWLDLSTISKKGQLAKDANVPDEIIYQTQKMMFSESFRSAALVGLGAFFITNYIPSAFELSIFTLEIISLLAPFTLDKIILRNKEKTLSLLPIEKNLTTS